MLITLFSPLAILPGGAVFAGPVDWHEVPATEAGQQWWDKGSLRSNKEGLISVLSRFAPKIQEGENNNNSKIYVMQIDCSQRLFRDTSVNGLPRLRSEWVQTSGDGLIDAVIDEVCNAEIA
ncbi:MAG: hypothetical protein AB8A46_00470 [Prochlorococcus sp.]|jgi:hypothetical protein|nr:hypothetical protein [Prochlorococcus sp.]MDP6192943.1 hypothetical protein [Prochlorococcaceae cyanobacterium ETNP18_MAG_1]CAI8166825.1 MAG: Uncharacterised protein [Prochlorococcus marinus str. MIT 9215]